MDANGKQPIQLTTESYSELAPAVATHGDTIVYLSYRDNVPHVWRMKLDGSDAQQITKGAGESEASLTPDGQWVVYLEADKELHTLWKIPITGGTPIKLSNLPMPRAVLAPDGKIIACSAQNKPLGKQQIYLLAN